MTLTINCNNATIWWRGRLAQNKCDSDSSVSNKNQDICSNQSSNSSLENVYTSASNPSLKAVILSAYKIIPVGESILLSGISTI